MRKFLFVAGLILAPGFANATVPDWAAPETAKDTPKDVLATISAADDVARKQVFPTVPDSVPLIVRKGKKSKFEGVGPGICMACHLPSGFGQPQSAPIAGLPSAYIVHQLMDMNQGSRMTYRKDMGQFAMNLTEEEMKTLGDYYASLSFVPWIEVKESDTAPKTVIGPRDIVAPAPGGGEEPLGQRIVEIANDPSKPYFPPGPSYTAYVPKGSVEAGAALVTTGGGGKTVACGGCHAPNLLGKADTPAIAGRSPIYVARELYEFKDGTRNGMTAAAMKRVAANLTDEDIVNISAYVASRPSK